MALITRVSRLFTADVHAVLDRIEEPEALLRQAVREMEDELAGDRRRLKLLDHEAGQISARLAENERALAAIGNQLDVCFAAGKPDLARSLIRRRLELERFAGGLGRRGRMLADARAALGTRIEENQAQLDAMRQKAELLAGTTDESDGPLPGTWPEAQTPVTDEEVEVALLREQQRRAEP